MKATQCLNIQTLRKVWSNNHPEDARWQHWLHHVLHNELLRNAASILTVNSPYAKLMGLKLDVGITERDKLVGSNPSRRHVNAFQVVDLYAFDVKIRRHYHLGGILYYWCEHSFSEHAQQINHLYEALTATQKRKDWSVITVSEAQNIADKWVEELNRRAIDTGGKTGIVWSRHSLRKPLLPTYTTSDGDTPPKDNLITTDSWEVHLLLDEVAYKAEGLHMKHCVASYWGGDSQIYSLRFNGNRVATIEVKSKSDSTKYCPQIRGFANAAPEKDALDMSHQFLTSQNITLPAKLTWPNMGVGINAMLSLPQGYLYDNSGALFTNTNMNMQLDTDVNGNRELSISIRNPSADIINQLRRLLEGARNPNN